MDSTFILCYLAVLVPAVILFRSRSNVSSRLPPGPPGWPVFGNMFELGSMPHKTISNLRKEYGPVLWLRIGSINTMVVQTAGAATELFKNQDANFVERNITEVMRSHGFNKAAVSLSPYGSYWRVMKRIMTMEMLTQRRINETEGIRRQCIADMVEWIGRGLHNGRIHVARFVFLESFNMLGNLMLSQDLVNPDSEEGSEFFEGMNKLMGVSGTPNIVDLFPCLKRFDPQGLRRKMDSGMGKTLSIVAGFVEKRLKERESKGKAKKDFLEVLLENQGSENEDNFSLHQLNIVIMEVFLAGSDTTSSTIEWAMVELLKNPEAMKEVKSELARVVGSGNTLEETHIDKLPYLQAVIKETLRLHPPIPFLVPRRAMEETEFMGYRIPKNTQVFVNAWAIGRDPDFWNDPLSFKPGRFVGLKTDYRGHNFELIPFGSGRRICAGIPLAHRMLHMVLGSLVHEFEWQVDEVAMNSIMDTRERIGVTVRKTVPLEVIAIKCSI